nr:dolichyl-phosphate beta-glucosyltransferase [Tanacetum cinerariifolium]
MLHSQGKLLLMLDADGAPKVDDVAKLEKQGMLHSQGKLLLMLDADGAPKVDDVAKLEKQ